jgi:hypothetical protein
MLVGLANGPPPGGQSRSSAQALNLTRTARRVSRALKRDPAPATTVQHRGSVIRRAIMRWMGEPSLGERRGADVGITGPCSAVHMACC